MSKEGEPYPFRIVRRSEPVHPVPLPPELTAFLETQRAACLMHETTAGTVYVVKLPGEDIDSARGTVPIRTRHELYAHPKAPVIRTVITIYDQPERPLGLETVTNIADPDQRAEFARLANQRETFLLFYDEQLRHRLSKRIETADSDTIREIVRQADEVRRRIPLDQYDFDAAKAAVLHRAEL